MIEKDKLIEDKDFKAFRRKNFKIGLIFSLGLFGLTLLDWIVEFKPLLIISLHFILSSAMIAFIFQTFKQGKQRFSEIYAKYPLKFMYIGISISFIFYLINITLIHLR